jgi:hypothetical protein
MGLISYGVEARERLRHLYNAIEKLAPTYEGLETAFDTARGGQLVAVHPRHRRGTRSIASR